MVKASSEKVQKTEVQISDKSSDKVQIIGMVKLCRRSEFYETVLWFLKIILV